MKSYSGYGKERIEWVMLRRKGEVKKPNVQSDDQPGAPTTSRKTAPQALTPEIGAALFEDARSRLEDVFKVLDIHP
ncbi:hypothetical protein HSBAA_04450 [Vreelandella sulfidaeris]|uniref:Uncharacterized protein n=1 Tax=Vreelandella sulfidaeris TaxID=115553 RepID=A0A455U321_9GAMM|nr:hypothetical protein HSBAA_04450 [Halomonas sulfidaeris]